MKLEGEAKLLRIFIGESDKHGHVPLYEAIVAKAREAGLAGATVLHGSTGFGANSRVHTAKILRLSEDLPIVVEIVDKEDKIDAFLPELDAMIDEGMVTIETVRALMYRHSQG
jgi:PII-like signaling protein